ncbi:copper chaperone PCu(A)C [Actinoplanes sp. NPDC051411]|uniref:copper chaperone PCu(A)C n=1 Tax=Actinoplanes sp. NPDC051411 TaxID=3155522 RepID=UPI00342C5490
MVTAASRLKAPARIALVTAFAVGACGTASSPPAGNVNDTGVDTLAGNLHLLAVHVPAPSGDGYPKGADLRVILTIVNLGRAPDALVAASTPDARKAEIRWDRNCDSKPDVVSRLPIAPADDPAPAERGVQPFDPYDVLLVAATREVLAGTEVPLTLRFTTAGTVRTSAYVLPKTAHIEEPVRTCKRSP